MQDKRRARYTLEFKLEAIGLVKAGQSAAVVAATLAIADQTLQNWLKVERGVNPAADERV